MSVDSESVRSIAAGVVDRSLASRQPVALNQQQVAQQLSSRDRRLLYELVLGTLRWLRRLDSVIEAASSRDLTAIDAALLSPLRIAVYQFLFLDRIPVHAAVDEAVKEARRRTHRGGAGFVNAVLRRIARSPQLDSWPVKESELLRRIAIETSHPDWLVERWWQSFGEVRTRSLLDTNNRLKPRQILTFEAKGGRERTAALLAAEGVQTKPSDLAPMGLVVTAGEPLASNSLRDGSIYLQDVASQAAALIPAPADSERVLDVAAAPGGKSFSLLAMNSKLQVVAADKNLGRLMIMRENRDRLGLDIRLALADGLAPPIRQSMDRVILDLPCTGTGTLRKNPELKWRVNADEVRRLSSQGLQMVDAASCLVRLGGILSVVTCSLEPEENSAVVARFLASHGGFKLLPLASELPPDLSGWTMDSGGWQILPEDVHDGFTVHVLRRVH